MTRVIQAVLVLLGLAIAAMPTQAQPQFVFTPLLTAELAGVMVHPKDRDRRVEVYRVDMGRGMAFVTFDPDVSLVGFEPVEKECDEVQP